ncbi:hypothetical protein [Qipengyuania flava]|uniref:hypothetical protein n=1 Tax=Qipengyuania flava TaxID=192812 RepID=UPI001C62759B|nr:hypothetical protein [Qipengyuania flava]QYJ05999.1 hypothetical protein KUV82_07785 [Qipengyuania flava]
MTPTPHRRRADDKSVSNETDNPGLQGAHGGDTVLLAMQRAETLGVTITIWDLPQVTELPLHAAFAAVRALEAERMVVIGDNPSDPFGATLELAAQGLKRLNKLKAA